jgi:hypothetical protein
MSEETRNEPHRDMRPGADYKRYGMENEDWRHMDQYWQTMYGDSYPYEKEWNRGKRVVTDAGQGLPNDEQSDERIQEEVQNQLRRNPMVDATEINLSVHDGFVVLRGTVDRRGMKETAEEVAESVSGVRDVRNEIRIHKIKGHEGKRAA